MITQSAAYQHGVESYLCNEYAPNPYATETDEYVDFQNGWWDTHYAALSSYEY